jgi:predicted AlkP superfamily pyrophosphatase or phosphodiesterase
MINDHTLARFAPLGTQLLKPIYDDYAFANIAATVHFLLSGERIGALLPPDCFGGSYPKPDKVVLIFVDSFGWQFWQRYGERSRLMRHVITNGVLTPISALFPSTTAASVSTLNLGCLPVRHAVYEWQMYVPAIGETIQSLPFATLGPRVVSCASLGHDVRDLVMEHETAHQRLARHGVRSIQLAHRAYANSPYNGVVTAGAEVVTHGSLAEGVVHLKEAVTDIKGRAFISFYWAGLDTAAHIFGPGSAVHDAEVMSYWLTLDGLLADLRSQNTLVLFTADHGHVGAKAEDTIYINERFPDLAGTLAQSPTGQTIWPNGSPRDMFLHIVPERRAEVQARLTAGLQGQAEVMSVDDALAAGLFGAEPVSAELRRRLGDILVLPHLGTFVWWREPGIMKNPFHGHHGGLSAEELVTMLGVVDSFG